MTLEHAVLDWICTESSRFARDTGRPAIEMEAEEVLDVSERDIVDIIHHDLASSLYRRPRYSLRPTYRPPSPSVRPRR
jgi:hypothetical protein